MISVACLVSTVKEISMAVVLGILDNNGREIMIHGEGGGCYRFSEGNLPRQRFTVMERRLAVSLGASGSKKKFC